MELIGQFDSPFARRVGLTLTLYGLPFTHNRWSVFGNADELAKVNPLIRVPTLVLDNGEMLIETGSIIDYLDGLVSAEKRLTPPAEPARHRVLRTVGVASGVSDMAVRLFYEQRLHDAPSPYYVERLTKQMSGALAWLDREAPRAGHWHGTMTQADLAVTCMWRHLSESQPAIADKAAYPALAAHAARMEELQVFKDISQPFIAPA